MSKKTKLGRPVSGKLPPWRRLNVSRKRGNQGDVPQRSASEISGGIAAYDLTAASVASLSMRVLLSSSGSSVSHRSRLAALVRESPGRSFALTGRAQT